MMDEGEIQALERIGFRAWPALEEVEERGWVYRYARGHTKRANSVTPLNNALKDLEKRVDDAEERFAARGLRSIFRLTPLSPPDLLRLLRRRGYEGVEPTSVMVADLSMAAPDAALVVHEDPLAWLTATNGMYGLEPEILPFVAGLIAAIDGPKALVTLEEDGRPVGSGYAAVIENQIGLFKIVTDASMRNRGIGRRVVAGLMALGRQQGGRRAYLQVRQDNAPAVALYQRLGFREAYPYLHRVKTLEGAAAPASARAAEAIPNPPVASPPEVLPAALPAGLTPQAAPEPEPPRPARKRGRRKAVCA